MQTKKKLSIIIPLYNVEDYVYKAIESVTNQSFEGLEIVLVDDGSTDASLETALSALNGFKDVISIKQANIGLGGARNSGVKGASGEYVMFLDSDDYLLPEAFTNIMKVLEKDHPDVLFGRYVRHRSQGVLLSADYEFRPPTSKEKRTEYILGALPEPSWNAWRYVCRREFIVKHKLAFEPGVYCEDVKWSLILLETADTISFLREPFYAYNDRRPGSIMNARTVKRLLDLNATVLELTEKYAERPEICRVLIRESFFYINEYCTFSRKDRKVIFERYKAVLSRFKLSSSRIHHVAGLCGSPPALYMLSVALYFVKHVRRFFMKPKAVNMISSVKNEETGIYASQNN